MTGSVHGAFYGSPGSSSGLGSTFLAILSMADGTIQYTTTLKSSANDEGRSILLTSGTSYIVGSSNGNYGSATVSGSPDMAFLALASPGTPTTAPTIAPSAVPSISPSEVPSMSPTVTPSEAPTGSPSMSPTMTPSEVPTAIPSMSPTTTPSEVPTANPTLTQVLTTYAPSVSPTATPSETPSVAVGQTYVPTYLPSMSPSVAPVISTSPSVSPALTNSPSFEPSGARGLINPAGSKNDDEQRSISKSGIAAIVIGGLFFACVVLVCGFFVCLPGSSAADKQTQSTPSATKPGGKYAEVSSADVEIITAVVEKSELNV